MVVRAQVSNKEEAFDWLVVWLSKQKNIFSSRNLSLRSKKSSSRGLARSKEGEKKELEFLPGQGFHMFPFKGRLIWMSRVAGKTMSTGWDAKPFKFETLYLKTYGRSAAIFQGTVC